MNQTCPSCKSSIPINARFCQTCGATLGATSVQGRTVVCDSPQAPLPMSDAMIKTVVRQATAAYGSGPMSVVSSQAVGSPLANQREQTIFVVDISVSMEEEFRGGMTKLEAAKRANITMILNKAQIDPYDEIGLVSFDDRSLCVLNLCPIHL